MDEALKMPETAPNWLIRELTELKDGIHSLNRLQWFNMTLTIAIIAAIVGVKFV